MIKILIEHDGPARCGNCAWHGSGRECGMIQDIGQRLTAGAMVPCGECPDCRALCYPDNKAARVSCHSQQLYDGLVEALEAFDGEEESVKEEHEELISRLNALLDSIAAGVPPQPSRWERIARACGWDRGGDNDDVVFHTGEYESWKAAVSWSPAQGEIYESWKECVEEVIEPRLRGGWRLATAVEVQEGGCLFQNDRKRSATDEFPHKGVKRCTVPS